MLFPNSKVQAINDLLQRIGRKFQLDNSKIEKIEQTYKSLTDWISVDEKFWGKANTQLYPQGSKAIGTSLIPFPKSDEFDLDFVTVAMINHNNLTPTMLYDNLFRRLYDNEIYKDKLEKKNRCIRINYKSDYHVDILPACLASVSNQELLKIPDRELKNWCDSNPKGYIRWFKNINQKFQPVLFEKAEIENLPENQEYENLLPLQRAVQLMKRFKDVYFKDIPDFKPSSIIITTLAAQNYAGENSEYSTINNILVGILSKIETIKYYGIPNPLNENENFADKMLGDRLLFDSFEHYVKDFKAKWETLPLLEGLDKIAFTLSNLFGEKVVQTAVNEYSEFINKSRNNLTIGVNPIARNIITTKVIDQPFIKSNRNTNFGD